MTILRFGMKSPVSGLASSSSTTTHSGQAQQEHREAKAFSSDVTESAGQGDAFEPATRKAAESPLAFTKEHDYFSCLYHPDFDPPFVSLGSAFNLESDELELPTSAFESFHPEPSASFWAEKDLELFRPASPQLPFKAGNELSPPFNYQDHLSLAMAEPMPDFINWFPPPVFVLPPPPINPFRMPAGPAAIPPANALIPLSLLGEPVSPENQKPESTRRFSRLDRGLSGRAFKKPEGEPASAPPQTSQANLSPPVGPPPKRKKQSPSAQGSEARAAWKSQRAATLSYFPSPEGYNQYLKEKAAAQKDRPPEPPKISSLGQQKRKTVDLVIIELKTGLPVPATSSQPSKRTKEEPGLEAPDFKLTGRKTKSVLKKMPTRKRDEITGKFCKEDIQP